MIDKELRRRIRALQGVRQAMEAAERDVLDRLDKLPRGEAIVISRHTGLTPQYISDIIRRRRGLSETFVTALAK